ncbi:MAG: hypothetical protein Kow0080_35830 [Candidatus Promineifilaceae bacterium]
MLTSTIIHLQAQANGHIAGSTARAIHGFWFQQWQNTAPVIADTLHQSNQTQPYTLSPLMGLPRPHKGETAVAAKQTAWLRITTLHTNITTPFLQNWLTRLPAAIELAGIPWAVQTIALSPAQHPLAAQTSYQELQATPPAAKWRLHLRTPTTFSAENDHFPFPLPYSLVNSWLRRWQTFAPTPLPIDDNFTTRLRQQLHISAYDLKTVPVRHGRRLEIGCVGYITLNGHRLSPQDRATITTLAAYAFYCGSGRHTTQGMGLTIAD